MKEIGIRPMAVEKAGEGRELEGQGSGDPGGGLGRQRPRHKEKDGGREQGPARNRHRLVLALSGTGATAAMVPKDARPSPDGSFYERSVASSLANMARGKHSLQRQADSCLWESACLAASLPSTLATLVCAALQGLGSCQMFGGNTSTRHVGQSGLGSSGDAAICLSWDTRLCTQGTLWRQLIIDQVWMW